MTETLELPYYYTASGECPPWFSEGQFKPDLFDATVPYTPKGTTYRLESNPDKVIENPYDLRNLRIINPLEVVRAVEELEVANRTERRPAICVIATGGTIASAMVGDELVPAIDISEIFGYVGRFYNRKYNYSAFSFPTLIDSSQMKLDYDADMVIAMSYIWKRMSENLRTNFQGFIISHGTDTFGPSLTRVDQMLGPNKDFSAVGVASQDNIEAEFNDVADNFGRAVASLTSLYRSGKKVVGGYVGGSAGGLCNPNGMLKISDTDIKGFDSPALDLIIDASNTRRARQIVTPFQDDYRRHPQLDIFHPIVMRGTVNSRLIEAQMDIPGDELTDQIAQVYRDNVIAVMVRTYGSFTFERGQVDGIVRGVRARNMLLFATNPFPTGEIDHQYADALYLIQQNAIPLHMMPHAAAVKLLYGEHVFGNNQTLLEAFMTSNNGGEQPHHVWTPRPLPENIDMRPLGQPRQSIPTKDLELYPV